MELLDANLPVLAIRIRSQLNTKFITVSLLHEMLLNDYVQF